MWLRPVLLLHRWAIMIVGKHFASPDFFSPGSRIRNQARVLASGAARDCCWAAATGHWWPLVAPCSLPPVGLRAGHCAAHCDSLTRSALRAAGPQLWAAGCGLRVEAGQLLLPLLLLLLWRRSQLHPTNSDFVSTTRPPPTFAARPNVWTKWTKHGSRLAAPPQPAAHSRAT